jgi:DNA polymerase elongation subunit (family B)
MEDWRLLTFNVFDKNNFENDENRFTQSKSNKEFIIQMFGINEKGETVSIYVEGYSPFFYIKVPDNWKDSHRCGIINQIREELGYYSESIINHKFVEQKTLYGFDGGKKYKFILIEFCCESSMKKAKNLWYSYNSKKERFLDAYEYGPDKTYLYEANIPPLLRMFHIKEISPSGWISIPLKKAIKHKRHTTSCTYEYTINYNNIVSLPNKECSVPYKICSYDIEASSSHGDFPLAKKDYKKLATNIVDIWDDNELNKSDSEYLKDIIYTAFNLTENKVPDVDIVYPKTAMNSSMLDLQFKLFEKVEPISLKNDIEDDEANNYSSDEENECDEGTNEENIEETGKWFYKKSKPKAYRKKGTIIDLLNEEKVDRDTKIMEITKACNKVFPKLEGDIVTFIGSTFLKYGEEKPYLNHCLVKGTCSNLPQIENSKIECVDNEKDLLSAWADLIQEEDPDIIIGYNIFGFDYSFMYERAKELGCVKKFLKLSRNKQEVCLSKKWNWNTKQEEQGLESNTLYIASGQHDLKYVKMNGRLQIDMYNLLRRDYQLIKYKLDYVGSYFIGDYVTKIEHIDNITKIYTKNLTGLENGNYITIEEEAHSVDNYKNGLKFKVNNINENESSFCLNSIETPDMKKKVRWGLAKDDVTPQDIFRMTNEGPDERAIIAKYCIQDCNLVHHLLRKIDVITGFVEMSSLCSVPMDFLVMRGQGIKLTSYIAKKCREKNTLIPVIEKTMDDEGYEGAIVLPPKCKLYLEDPVACVDYSSLYPSSMISENISHDSKVLTKEYDLENQLIKEEGEKDSDGNYIYDNLPNYKYVDIKYDTYKWQRKNDNPKAAMEKVIKGYKICRYAQFPEGKGIMPSILEELLAARKATRKLIPQQKDDFMKNVLDKRQLSIKVTANSMYGQTGAKTSTFYEKDCAASTTAIGRKLLTYAQRVIEEAYDNIEVETQHGIIIVKAEYVYGDTDSVFFKFNPKELDGTKIIGQKALEITIELAKKAGELATLFLKKPHDLEYEKTFLPFCLLSKKRYVGMLYEDDPHKCKRKSMGIVLKRRDNAPIVKDVYGGVIDILMKDKNVEKAVEFTKQCLQDIIDEKYSMDKLVITKSLRSGYKNPKQIAHKVLADRIGKRDPGNKPSPGDRIAYAYIENSDKKALQGERIETPEFIKENNLSINYAFYITNQIMKPLQQVFGLVLEDLRDFKKKKGHTLRKWKEELEALREKYPDIETYRKKEEALRNKEVKALIFDKYLKETTKK